MKQMFQDKLLVQFEIVIAPNEALRVEGSSGNRHGLIYIYIYHQERVQECRQQIAMVLTLYLIPFFLSAVGWFKVVKKVQNFLNIFNHSFFSLKSLGRLNVTLQLASNSTNWNPPKVLCIYIHMLLVRVHRCGSFLKTTGL